jgi:hypothetical protein
MVLHRSPVVLQATRRLVLDVQLRKSMGTAARESSWKFERNIILQQMAENYKDAIDKHRDPAFLKRHMLHPEGAGRNLLSVFCCNYYFIKMIAEPFLNTSRGVQDLVDHTTECMQMSRSRLSCSDLLTSASMAGPSAAALASQAAAAADGKDVENGDQNKYEKTGRKWKIFGLCSSCVPAWLNSPNAGRNVQFLGKLTHFVAIALTAIIILLFMYATFTVK